MTLTEKRPEDKIFGKNMTKVLSIRIPEDQYESILAVVKEYVNNFREDNVKKIETIKDNIKEIISMYLDVKDYIWKQKSITSDKYYSILFNHNKDLIDDLIDNYPIERKKPVKTVKEENREKEEKLRKEELKKNEVKENSSSIRRPLSYYDPKTSLGVYGTPEYNKNLEKYLREIRKRTKKRNKRR